MEKSMLKENTVHGSNIYPYAVYRWNGQSASAVPLHWHGETEIIYLKAGTFSFSVNTKEYEQEAPALQYIRSHYDGRLTVEEIADAAGLNVQYFCRYFKKNTGKTVTEYINEIRINHAAKMLLESEDKIIDIAGQCGYDNVGYFIKRFRQCKGITPSDYRKGNREKVNIV